MKSALIKNEQIQGTLRCSSLGKLENFSQENSGFHELLNLERSKSFAEGKEEGEKIGYARAKEEMEDLIQLLQSISDKMLEHKKELFHHLKPEVIDLVIAIAERVIRIELSQPEKLTKLIESFLTQSAFQGEVVKIFLAPEDMCIMEKTLNKIQYDMTEIKGIRIAVDPLQRQGDVRIETKSTLQNFTLSRELEDLRLKVARA